MRPIRSQVFLFLLVFGAQTQALQANCVGHFVNPITDLCWECVFPLKVAGIQVVSGGPDPDTSSNPICFCPKPPLPEAPGIPISFWEPARLVDVTRTPYCLVAMGGVQLSDTGIKSRGHVSNTAKNPGHHQSFYHVHWYVYPILYWLEVLMDFICLESSAIDLAYITELDPFWNDDEKSAILNPEALLFGNPIAQMACLADCAKASFGLPINALFWCSGCQGSMYPFTGTVKDHSGGVQASLLLAGRFMAKLHREGLLWGYYGDAGKCQKYPMPIIHKSQYRTQMVYPIPQTSDCQPLGATEVKWQGGKEFPYKGEDFAYMIWRRRQCCLV